MSTTTTVIPNHGTELLYQLSDSGKYLYHYTSAAVAFDNILPTNKLRLSPYTQTNDPKESKEWEFSAFVPDGSSIRFDDWPRKELCARMNEGLKNRTNVLCLSCDGQLTGNHLEDIYNRGWCRPRMWAHYGDEHRGVCLVFEREKLERAFDCTFPTPRPIACGKVSYVNRPVVGPFGDPTYSVNLDLLTRIGWEKYIATHLKHCHQRLFFEKNADWSGENEYRFVTWEGTGDYEYVDFADALRGIMFGASVDEETIWAFFKATYGRKLLLEQLFWRGCAPWYDLGKWFSLEVRYRKECRAAPLSARQVPTA